MRNPRLADIALPQFRSRTPWWGPDLQTLRNSLVAAPMDTTRFPGKRVTLPLADGTGDALVGLHQAPAAPTGRPLAVLVHGLSGSEDSAYMIASTQALLENGYPVLRLNLRGAGPARSLCRYQYHAGRSHDLRDVLASDAFADAFRDHTRQQGSAGLVLVGYSLGANMLLKFLAEFGDQFPIVGACAVSAPIDLEAASYRFLHPRNVVYHWNLLRNMKREALDEAGVVTRAEREAIASARSILEFDERFVAPRNGYPDAAAYYADNMARRFLGDISVPTLVIHALDDPWIPSDPYTSYPWADNPNLLPVLASGGGHVGFHGDGSTIPWHDRCLLRFFDALRPHAESFETR